MVLYVLTGGRNQMMSKQKVKAFTIIELMTTVAIVAIMAAIAVQV